MRSTRWLLALLLAGLWHPPAAAHHPDKLDRINQCLAGRIVDHTNNHGADHRLWSPALQAWKDLYVYLPPEFDPARCYPVMLWLHGFREGAGSMLDHVARPIDQAIVAGRLPPIILAAAAANTKDKPGLFCPPTFYVNSNAGNYEDYIIQDVWGFLVSHYPIRPEREAHVIAGFSMGGFGAYNLGFKHPELFKVILGFCPPVNMRWVDCNGNYQADFNPCCWGWRTQVDRGHEVIGRVFGGVVTVRLKRLIDPLYGRERGPQALDAIIRENPIEMIDRLGVREGLYAMYVAYGGRDEYNIDAQVESFLYLARERGLTVGVSFEPKGRHSMTGTGAHLFPEVIAWLGPLLAPFGPTGAPESFPPLHPGPPFQNIPSGGLP